MLKSIDHIIKLRFLWASQDQFRSLFEDFKATFGSFGTSINQLY